MSTGTGFLIGAGTVVVAIAIGFTGGYVITSPDPATKVAAAAYTKSGDRGGDEAARTEATAVENPAKPQVIASAPEPTPPTANISTAPLSVQSVEAAPVTASAPPAAAPAASTPAAAPVAAPATASVAVPPNEPARTNEMSGNRVEQGAKEPARAAVQPQRKTKIARKNVAQPGSKLDMAEVRRAIAEDVKRRQAEASFAEEPRRGGLLPALYRD